MDDGRTPHATTEQPRLCPYAIATTAYDMLDQQKHLVSSGCRRWQCPQCAAIRKAHLIRRIMRAAPNRMLTLTCRHEHSPNKQLANIRKHLPKLVVRLRRSHGSIEYIRILEQCADGYPHFHLLCRSGFLPQAEIRKQWEALTGARIVDVRKAHGKSAAYVAKYIAKALEIQNEWGRQRLSVSRSFWRPEKENPNPLIGFDRTTEHPTEYAQARAEETAFIRKSGTCWRMADREPGDELPPELAFTYQQFD